MYLQKSTTLVGTALSFLAGYDYFLDIRMIKEIHDDDSTENFKDKSHLVISRKLHSIHLDQLKSQLILMINPQTQQYLISRVDKIAQDNLDVYSDKAMFHMKMPQGTFYCKMNGEVPKTGIDFTNIHSSSQIQGVPMIII